MKEEKSLKYIRIETNSKWKRGRLSSWTSAKAVGDTRPRNISHATQKNFSHLLPYTFAVHSERES